MTPFADDLAHDATRVLDVVDNIKNTVIKPSLIHGYGLFAKSALAAGTVLTVLDGQRVDYDFYYRICDKFDLKDEIKNQLFMEWNCISGDMLLVRQFRTKYSYINHSRTPNCKLMGFPPTLWTCTEIKEGDELTLDYRDEPLPQNYISRHGSTYL